MGKSQTPRTSATEETEKKQPIELFEMTYPANFGLVLSSERLMSIKLFQ